MNPTPVVAIIGRPNVGKSMLFNRLTHTRQAVVHDEPGVTRDRLYGRADAFGKEFRLIDTGGLDRVFGDDISAATQAQAALAMDEADIILFMLDGQDGIGVVEHEIADQLRRSGKPVVLVANKLESLKKADVDAAWDLRLGEPLPISALHGTQVGDLLERLHDLMPEQPERAPDRDEDEDDEEELDDAIKVAVVGRPNVGKSSLVNAILGEQRVIVSDVPGTTRDAIDSRFERGGVEYVLVDTAGIRRKARVAEAVEYYSVLRAMEAIERCHVAVLALDALEGITDQDKRIAGMADDAGRGLILVVNKWDLLLRHMSDPNNSDLHVDEKMERLLRGVPYRQLPREYAKYIRDEVPFAAYAPVIATTAIEGEGVAKVLAEANLVAEHHAFRVPTPSLNQFLRDLLDERPPQTRHGKKLSVFYVSQVRVKPPTFAFFVNDPKLVHFSFERFMENRLREQYNFEGVPLRLRWRPRRESGDDQRGGASRRR